MDKIQKLLRRIPKKDHDRIIVAMEKLLMGNTENGDIEKIIGTNFYRKRVGRYRIIFYFVENKVILYDIRQRNDNTYN